MSIPKGSAESVSDLEFQKYIEQFGFLTKPAVAIDADIIMGEAKWIASVIRGEKAKQCHILTPEGPGVLNDPTKALAPTKQKELAFVESIAEIRRQNKLAEEEKIWSRDELPQVNMQTLADSPFTYSTIEVPINANLKPSQTQRIAKYSQKAVRLLKKGKEKPIIIDKHGYIVNGHHRYDAYKKLNYKTIPAIKVNATIEELIDKYM